MTADPGTLRPDTPTWCRPATRGAGTGSTVNLFFLFGKRRVLCGGIVLH